jgi:hypothetical protein
MAATVSRPTTGNWAQTPLVAILFFTQTHEVKRDEGRCRDDRTQQREPMDALPWGKVLPESHIQRAWSEPRIKGESRNG